MSWRDDISEKIAAGKKLLERRGRLAHAYQQLWNDPDGCLVLTDILRRSGLLEVTTAPAEADERAYRDGRRSLGIDIIALLRWSAEEVVAFAKERANEDRADREDGV